ncbi:DUF1643 domain-containing protein [Comamonas squillarum]|uniref:DUF1643 domain-containing protein n=1 Tax=Comamonas squillarum TaxID=2977320 RepID=A0ABY5ZXP5_9BURK|nr:DUF1643 domain-containing protein [Comamonas sp. PR12]UXC17445.1 DUF1643 domain-containing protein [Comamonas sp. PR12]
MNLYPHIPAAVISDCGQYRYMLSRQIGLTDRVVTFIGLNPSTADATLDDPTIRRCIGFAKRRDAGLLVMVNLFALRSTDPRALQAHTEPVGPENDTWIDRAVSMADIAIAAWGNGGTLMGRSDAVRGRLQQRLEALAITNTGMPKHPLYVRADAETVSY